MFIYSGSKIAGRHETSRMSYCRYFPCAAATIIISAFLLLHAGPARAEQGIVIGDSISRSMAKTVGLKTIARNSFSFRRHDIRRQLRRIPNGAIVLLSAGLNDAADPVRHLVRFIEKTIVAVNQSGHRIVWLGPPCVLKRWDGAAKKLDAYLSQRLARTKIQYVSLRDKNICRRSMRTGDGEHFKSKGYRYVWNKIRADSSFAATVKTR